ncbi:MAG: hypothetical protein ACE5JM_05510 [Armatimonadota bacterium]
MAIGRHGLAAGDSHAGCHDSRGVNAINACGDVHEKSVDYEAPPVIFVFSPLGEPEVDTEPTARGERMVVHTLEAATLYKRRSQGHFHPKYRRPEIYGDLARL